MVNKQIIELERQYKDLQKKHGNKTFKAQVVIRQPVSALPKIKRVRQLVRDIINKHHQAIGLPVDIDGPGASAFTAGADFLQETREDLKRANKNMRANTIRFANAADAKQFRELKKALNRLVR